MLSVSKSHWHLVCNSCSLTCTCSAVSEVKRSHLFDSKRVVAQKESQLFENQFSAAWITMNEIFVVTE